MRIVLPPPDAPVPASGWDRLPHVPGRWLGTVCAVTLVAWLLSQTGVTEISPSAATAHLPLAQSKPGATDWPGWRGPSQQGLVEAAVEPPLQWVASDAAAWRARLPGEGSSAPCVWGNGIYLTARRPDTGQIVLLSYDRDTGRLQWQTDLGAGLDAAPTPACDGLLVYVPVAQEGQVWLHAVDVNGTLKWKRAAGPLAGTKSCQSSPVVNGSLVYVAVDHRGARWERWRSTSTLTAFHRQTGEIVWRALRLHGDSAGTPIVAEISGRPQLVLAGRRNIISYDPETGAELWTCRWSADRVVGSVAFDEQHVFACARHPDAETLCIRADGEGDITDTHIVWRERRSPIDGPSPVVVGSTILLLGNPGALTALDKASGRLVWQRRLAGEFDASPVVVRNKLYATNREGLTFVVDLDRRGEVLAESPLGQPVTASLAISGQRLILRGERELILITPPARDIYATEPESSSRKF
jgi:outer membrane protein assembly factor BamB